MTRLDKLFTDIAHEYLGISTLETRRSDSLDFHAVAVWTVRSALQAAFDAGRKCSLSATKEPPSVFEQLPPDPDGMNDNRAAWAWSALSAFIQQTGTDEGDALPDLLADLMHWSDRRNYDFDLALDRARGHYEVETSEEGA